MLKRIFDYRNAYKNILMLSIISSYVSFSALNIQGNELVSLANIKYLISKAGGNVSVQEAVIILKDTGLFEDVVAQNGKIIVKEAPIISKITWKGKLLDKQLHAKLTGLKIGRKFNTTLKDNAINLIIQSLGAQNILAQVQIESKIINNKSVELTIHATSVRKAKINQLKIVGLKQLSQAKLKYHIPGQSNFLGVTYNLSAIETYKEQLRKRACQEGFYDFYIKSFSIGSDSPTNFTLYLQAHEGSRYNLGKITYDFPVNSQNPKHTSTLINKYIHKLKPNQVLNLAKIEQICEKITTNLSKINTNVQITPQFTKQTIQQTNGSVENIINVHFVIEHHQPLILRNIHIGGNSISESRLLRTITHLTPGQQLYKHNLTHAKDNLLSTGFIQDAQIYPINTTSLSTDLNVHVKEASQLKLSPKLQGGYGTLPYGLSNDKKNTGFLWSIGCDYGTPNFLGKGYDLQASIEFANKHLIISSSIGQDSLMNTNRVFWDIGMQAEIGTCGTGGSIYSVYAPEDKKTDNKISVESSDKIDNSLSDNKTSDNKQNQTANEKVIRVNWKQKQIKPHFSYAFSVTDNLYIGFAPKLKLSEIIFDSDNKLPIPNQLPRIFRDEYFQERTCLPILDFPITYTHRTQSAFNRNIGFKASLTPSVSMQNYGATFILKHNLCLDQDFRSNLLFKISGGMMRSFSDKVQWEHTYGAPAILEGFGAVGPREKTTMTSLGGQEYLAGQIKCILPLPIIGDKFRLFGFISAGTIGKSGITPEIIDSTTAEKLNLKNGAVDIINDEHSLRITAGAGLTLLLIPGMVINIGYSYPIRYKQDLDQPQRFYFTLTRSIDE